MEGQIVRPSGYYCFQILQVQVFYFYFNDTLKKLVPTIIWRHKSASVTAEEVMVLCFDDGMFYMRCFNYLCLYFYCIRNKLNKEASLLELFNYFCKYSTTFQKQSRNILYVSISRYQKLSFNLIQKDLI